MSIQINTSKIILGIDPGTSVTGYGLLSVHNCSTKLLDFGVINLKKEKTHALKLKSIFEKMLALIEKYKPDELAIESPFFGKNVQSMLKLGRAQGIVIAAALFREIPVFEYAPKKIKQAITGNGNASKEQVFRMLARMFGLKEKPKYLDASDGLAAALCHHLQKSNMKNKISKGKNYSGWKDFVKNNTERMIR